MKDPLFLVIDLFCGAGGTTTGFVQAELDGNSLVKVIACVNHDPKAIQSHWRNHPDVKHFEEDIRTLDLTPLVKLADYWRNKYPNAYLIFWASLECTNFSRAKGGLPRDPDSRTLADHLERYVVALQPDYIQIENVVEFMSWGPLDEKGKPISRKNGEDWLRWRKMVCSHGYVDQWRELNSANYGAYTSRNRLFGIFSRPYLPVAWPEPTHARNPSKYSIHGDLQPWKAVKEVLDFEDEGTSIFNRAKPLSDKTLGRIYAGLVKYVAKDEGKFLAAYYGNGDNITSVQQPAPTLVTKDRLALIQPEFFIVKFCGSGNHNNQSPERPVGSVMPKEKHGLVKCDPFTTPTNFVNQPKSNEPCPTVTARKHHYLINPSWGGNPGSVDARCPVIIARQDKAPLSLVQIENGPFRVPIYDDDSATLVKIKHFMAVYNIVDIKMRMLRVHELLKIQGFPADYKLEGNQAQQKKFIGNSVVPLVVQKWTEALAMRLIDGKTKVV